jgi:hypothetical protein
MDSGPDALVQAWFGDAHASLCLLMLFFHHARCQLFSIHLLRLLNLSSDCGESEPHQQQSVFLSCHTLSRRTEPVHTIRSTLILPTTAQD